MPLRALVIIGCVLACPITSISQTPAGAADPITGTWKGDIGLTDTERTPITFDLKFDGTSIVSGKVTGPGPAQFKSGTFTPGAGVLVLRVEVQDGRTAEFLFEGIAVNGAAMGRVSSDNQKGTFRLTRDGAAGGSAAPQSAPQDAASAVRAGFDEISGWLTKAAELVPAEKYTYQPVKTVRTFGQLIAHVVDGQNYYCGRATGKNVQWSDATANGPTDKATVVAKLKQSVTACSAAYASAPGAPPLVANLGHSSLHYGNVVTYLRMLGLTPPSS